MIYPDYNLAAAPETIFAPYDWIIPLQVDLFAEGNFISLEELEQSNRAQ